jgi:general secretion pathway protein H
MRGAIRRRASRGQHGFTLLELLVVMGVLALALTLVAPSLNRARLGVAVRTAAYEMAAHLRSARAAAREANMERVLAIDVDGRRYWSEGVVAPRQLPRGIAVELTVPSSERLLGTGVARVRFFPDGSTSGARVVLDDGRVSASIRVDWLTGDVRLEAR